MSGNVPWYGLLMHLSSLVFGLWVILYASLVKQCSLQSIGLGFLCVVGLGLPFVFSLQFTKAAFLAGLGVIHHAQRQSPTTLIDRSIVFRLSPSVPLLDYKTIRFQDQYHTNRYAYKKASHTHTRLNLVNCSLLSGSGIMSLCNSCVRHDPIHS